MSKKIFDWTPVDFPMEPDVKPKRKPATKRKTGNKTGKATNPGGRPAGPDPVVRVTVTIPGGLLERAKGKAKTSGVPLSALFARLLSEWLKG